MAEKPLAQRAYERYRPEGLEGWWTLDPAVRHGYEMYAEAVLAALCHDLQAAVDDYSLLSVRMGGRAWVPLGDVLALLAVVENDQ